MIVEREVVHSEDAVEFDEFQNLRRLGMKSFISCRRNYTAWVHDNGNQCKGFPAQTIEEQVRSIVSWKRGKINWSRKKLAVQPGEVNFRRERR